MNMTTEESNYTPRTIRAATATEAQHAYDWNSEKLESARGEAAPTPETARRIARYTANCVSLRSRYPHLVQ